MWRNRDRFSTMLQILYYIQVNQEKPSTMLQWKKVKRCLARKPRDSQFAIAWARKTESGGKRAKDVLRYQTERRGILETFAEPTAGVPSFLVPFLEDSFLSHQDWETVKLRSGLERASDFLFRRRCQFSD